MCDHPLHIVDETLRRCCAHEWARQRTLPLDFPHWLTADREGWTVAHEAAWYNHLPQGFVLWSAQTKNGVSVAEVFLERHAYKVHLPLPCALAFWLAPTSHKKRIKDWAFEQKWIDADELDRILFEEEKERRKQQPSCPLSMTF